MRGRHFYRALLPQLGFAVYGLGALTVSSAQIGEETSGYSQIRNGEEFQLSMEELLARGAQAFAATWTPQEGGGRPQADGTGGPLADPTAPLLFPRNFNRVSAMDSNSCAGCHNLPFPGGGGDFVTGVFVAGQRFDAVTFDHNDNISLRGAVNEAGEYVNMADVANYRATVGMFGAGYIEMLARQMTADLQEIRDGLTPGSSATLTTKGVEFGVLTRNSDGTSFDVSQITGLPEQSLQGPTPSLIIQPFHQSGSVISLRQFTNNAFNHHHGMQAEERFGSGVDVDDDGFVNELTRADITAATLWQASLQAPGQVVPRDPEIEQAILRGESWFNEIGCAVCHIPALPLDNEGWIFTEPNPYNPPGNLQPGDVPAVSLDLTDPRLPGYRLRPMHGVVMTPAFTDLKLHDITSGPDDPNREALNINEPGGSAEFLGGNRRFLTKKLWGAANERPFFHHGKFTTFRESILAHDGEARASRVGFESLSFDEQNCLVEFLKSLQVLPEHVKFGVVDENGHPRPAWRRSHGR